MSEDVQSNLHIRVDDPGWLRGMEEGDYVLIPFGAEADLPAEPRFLTDGFMIADNRYGPVQVALPAMKEFWELQACRVPATLLEGPVVIISADYFPEPLGPSFDLAYAVSETMGRSLPDSGRLSPRVERGLCALLLAGVAGLDYSCYFVVRWRRGGMEFLSFDPLGFQAACWLHTDTEEWPSLTAAAIDGARRLHRGLGSCPPGNQRPIAATDVLYHALLELDWRIRLLLLTIALEALFGTGRDELSHQISERAATFAYGTGEERIAVYRRLKGLYGTRSSFVHGTRMDVPWSKLEEEVYPGLELLERTVRLCLVRILSDESLVQQFCVKDQGKLNTYLDEMVLSPSPSHNSS